MCKQGISMNTESQTSITQARHKDSTKDCYMNIIIRLFIHPQDRLMIPHRSYVRVLAYDSHIERKVSQTSTFPYPRLDLLRSSLLSVLLQSVLGV